MDTDTSKQDKQEYRTLKKATGNNIVVVPTQLATITNTDYRNAISFVAGGNAYLQPLNQSYLKVGGLGYDQSTGTLLFQGFPATAARLMNYYTNAVPTNIDLPFLQLCYSIILTVYYRQMRQDGSVSQIVGVYFPQLARAIGKPRNLNRSDVVRFIHKLASFNSIMGIIDDEIQPVLIYAGEDWAKNTIYFQSPYLVKVCRSLYEASVRDERIGGHREITKNKNRTATPLPCHSRLANATLVKERNKTAVINVFNILYIIETAGANKPHVRAQTLIERNPQLQASLERQANPSNRNNILRRAFKGTWELLRMQTRLAETYKDIVLPNPADRANIPTTSTLDMVFTFPHKGKAAHKLVR